MDFRLLGPLEVSEQGEPLALGGVRQRSLLAVLLLQANELVSTDRLIDQLWGAAPPATGGEDRPGLRVAAAQALGERPRSPRAAPGYVLERRARRSSTSPASSSSWPRRGVPSRDRAAAKLREALALWRGPALADLAYESFAQVEIARLEELRLAVLEQRIEADLALGRHAELVGELEALVARYPLREPLRGQLMLALYRSGRQAEALDAYRAARRELAEELGLEPSEALQASRAGDPRATTRRSSLRESRARSRDSRAGRSPRPSGALLVVPPSAGRPRRRCSRLPRRSRPPRARGTS